MRFVAEFEVIGSEETVDEEINDQSCQIAFGLDRDGDHEIYVKDVDGGNVKQLTDEEQQ